MSTENKRAQKLKKYLFDGVITGGSCLLVVRAKTKQEAFKLYEKGRFDFEEGSEEWEFGPHEGATPKSVFAGEESE